MIDPIGQLLYEIMDHHVMTGEYEMAQEVLDCLIRAHRNLKTQRLEKGYGNA